ncbi:MAG TPA: minor capsid protein [Umezawaea sp.]|nr:minor capsid protein [Umezawaea sp.]
MTLLEELALLLQELGLGTYKPDDVDGTIYFPVLPDGPDACLAIARYGGTESSSRDPFDEPRIQVRCRGTAADSRPPEAAAQAVFDALHGLGMRTLPGGSELQLAVGIGSGPEYMGRDENRRHEYVVNFRVEVQRPTLVRPS